MSADEYVAPRELAAELDVDRRTVTRWIASGELEAFKLGPKLIRIRRSSVEAFLQRRRA